ncbi:Spo0E like sporulation regulatory protein [Clostridium aceticum]|uniref:Spo0E like sporulation regulatory protein n=1 Tax=Clostridium aceticum TaxID=84022 RepID=A0A0G3W8N3_9CLOT|nr:Spo0E family sporulation regulatory protein-aspartic acid phosphatase [Clostridium aceticum]AKL94225.1 Spo0E like sporulation regulatory protein [Clostridium aceticum]
MKRNKSELERLRKKLNDALSATGGKVTSDIIKTSQKLDTLIVREIKSHICDEKKRKA